MSSRTAAETAFEDWWKTKAAQDLGLERAAAWTVYRAAWWAGTEHVPTAREPWIPVGERLPDDDITVMIALKDSDEPVWFGFHDADGWHSATSGDPLGSVTHWKNTPDGPNE